MKTPNYIIPSILVHSKKEWLTDLECIKKTQPTQKMVHIDVMDGKFVPNTTWTTAMRIKKEKPAYEISAHLMVNNPENYIEKWANANAKRIFFHLHATKNPEKVINLIKKQKIKTGIAINPDVKTKELDLYLSRIDAVLVMSVPAGFGGQKFQSKTYAKIRALRKKSPKLKIVVDGGITEKQVQNLLKAGADQLVRGTSYYKLCNSRN